MLAAAFGAGAERELAAGLTGALGRGMLLLADRGFFSRGLWRQAAGTGADLLWRVKGDLQLPVLRVLPDGSFLSVLLSPDDARRAANRRHYRKTSARPRRAVAPRPVRAGTPVRVIAFALAVTASDGAARTESYRLRPPCSTRQPRRLRSWPPFTPAGGLSRPRSQNSRPTCAARAPCCGPATPPASARNCGLSS